MEFNRIDTATWDRKEYFEHYFSDVPCTYNITVNINVSKLLTLKLKLYPAMLYLITATVNKHQEFRTVFDKNGNLGIFDCMHPCYTIFHPESESFSNIWTEFIEDYNDFYGAYNRDLKLYGNIEKMAAKPTPPENSFPISMIPWLEFTGFNLNLQKGYNYLLPIFTIGKLSANLTLPLSIQVHHAVCDGFHISRFVNELQEQIDSFSL